MPALPRTLNGKHGEHPVIEARVELWRQVVTADMSVASRTCDEIVKSRPIPTRLIEAIYGPERMAA